MQLPLSVKAIISRNREILFLRNPRDEWELPGGRPEPGETLEDALIREVREECGLLVRDSHYISSRVAEVRPGRHVLIVCFACSFDGEQPRLSEEHSSIRWIPQLTLTEDHVPDYYVQLCLLADRQTNSFRPAEPVDPSNKCRRICSGEYPLSVGREDRRRLEITNNIYNGATIEFLSHYLPKENGAILEVGCGHGQISQYLSGKCSAARVVAVDSNARQLEVAQSLCGSEVSNLEFRLGDANTIGTDCQNISAFDLVFCRFTLLHIEDIRIAIKAMYACLKPGGIMICEEPSLSSLICFPDVPEFQIANHAIMEFGRRRGLNYDCAERVWDIVSGLGYKINAVNFSQRTIWHAEDKELILLSFVEFRPLLVAAKILTDTEADRIVSVLATTFMSPNIVTGGLRTIQLAIIRTAEEY